MTERTRTPRSNDASTFRPRFVRRRHRDGRCRQRRRPASGSRSHRIATREAVRPLPPRSIQAPAFRRSPPRRSTNRARVLRKRLCSSRRRRRIRRRRPGVRCGSNRGWAARQVASLGVDKPHHVRPSVRSAFGERHLEGMPAISLARSLQVRAVQAGSRASHLAPSIRTRISIV